MDTLIVVTATDMLGTGGGSCLGEAAGCCGQVASVAGSLMIWMTSEMAHDVAPAFVDSLAVDAGFATDGTD